jgi:hypothetical protein
VVIAIVLVVIAACLTLVALRSPYKRYVSELTVLTWPPRIRPLVYEKAAAIGHHFYTRVFVGKVMLPLTVYVNDSKIVTASLESKWAERKEADLNSQKLMIKSRSMEYPVLIQSNVPEVISDTGSLITTVIAQSFVTDFQPTKMILEAELVAGGISVAGEKIQRKHVGSDDLNFRWALSFERSGSHEIQVIFRGISVRPDGEIKFELYSTPAHRIRVVTIAGLTQKQLLWVTAISGALPLGWIVVQFHIPGRIAFCRQVLNTNRDRHS